MLFTSSAKTASTQLRRCYLLHEKKNSEQKIKQLLHGAAYLDERKKQNPTKPEKHRGPELKGRAIPARLRKTGDTRGKGGARQSSVRRDGSGTE